MNYAINDTFLADPCKHCAPLFIIEQQIETAPTANDPSATLTFIKFQERVYGITCNHVVTSLRNKIKACDGRSSHTFFIALKRHHVVQDRFVFPDGNWFAPEPDIAIRELDSGLPAYVGKVALDI